MRSLSSRAQLMAGGALFALCSGGYGHRSYAQDIYCVGPDAAGVITCTGGDRGDIGDLILIGDLTITDRPAPRPEEPIDTNEPSDVVPSVTLVDLTDLYLSGREISTSDLTVGGGSNVVVAISVASVETINIDGDLIAEGDIAVENRRDEATITIGGNATAGGEISARTRFYGEASITIAGDADAGDGILAYSIDEVATITIGGDALAGGEISSFSRNVIANVNIGGDATAGTDISVVSDAEGSALIIGGDAVAGGEIEALSTYDATVMEIGGSATAGQSIRVEAQTDAASLSIGDDAVAGTSISAFSGFGTATLTIDGDATAGGRISTFGGFGSSLSIYGNATANGDIRAHSQAGAGTLTITGDASSGGEISAYSFYASAEVAIGGNITAATGVTVTSYDGSGLAVGGGITASGDIRLTSDTGGASISVGDDVSTDGGMFTSSSDAASTILVGGNVAVGGALAVAASNGSSNLSIGGNAIVEEALSVTADGSAAALEVAGNVDVGTYVRVLATQFDEATVSISGDVTLADGIGAFSRRDTATVEVGGDVTATSTEVFAIAAVGGSYDRGDIAVSITNESGAISAAGGGVYARTSTGGRIDINVNDVTAAGDAVRISHGQNDALFPSFSILDTDTISVESTGLLSSSNGKGVNVFADLDSNAQIAIVVDDVRAGDVGIQSVSGSGRGVTITVNGDVVGGLDPDAENSSGIALLSSAQIDSGLPAFHRIDVSGEVSSAREGGLALFDYAGATRVTLNEGGILAGRSELRSYDDTLYAQGADLSQSGEIDGGTGGTDRIFITESTDVIGTNLTGFEELSLGFDFTFLLSGSDAFSFESLGINDATVGSLRAQFASDDTLTLDGDEGRVFVGAGNALLSGETLTITAAQGIELFGETDVPSSDSALVLGLNADCVTPSDPCNDTGLSFAAPLVTLSGGALVTGGTPGASVTTIDATAAGRGVTGGGTIDMQNGAVGDQVIVNGTVNLASRDGTGDVLRVDIDQAVADGDILTVRDDLFLSGNIDVDVINLGASEIAVSDHVVARSLIGVAALADGNGSVLTASTESIAASVEARFAGQEVIVQVTTDFAPNAENRGGAGLSGNGAVFGAYLNEVLNDPALADVRANVLGATSIEDLEGVYDQLDGSALNAAVASSAAIGADFAGSLFSCAVGEGQHAAIDEGQCTWTRVGAQFTDQDGSAGNAGSKQTVFSVSAGGQIEITDNLRLGAGIGFATLDSNSDNGLKLESHRISAGLSAKYVDGPMLIGASLGGGVTFSDSDRVAGALVARADFKTFDLTALTRAAYLFDLGQGFYMKPQVQAGVTFVNREAFTENGAGGANLAVASSSQTFAHASPSLEIGGDIETAGMTFRPYLRVGATILSSDSVETTARFAAAGVGTNFTSSVERDNLFGDLTAGVAIFSVSDVSVRAEYQGRISDNTTSHGGFLKLQFNF